MSDKITKRLRLVDKALKSKPNATPDFSEDDDYLEPVAKSDPKMLRFLSSRATPSK